MSDGLNYPDYLYGDALANKPGQQKPDSAQTHIVKAMEQTASASEHLVAALRLLRTAASTEHGQPREAYEAQTACDVEWSIKRGDYVPMTCEGNAYLAEFGPNVKEHRRVADADELRNYGIGDVDQIKAPDFQIEQTPHGWRFVHDATPRHPMMAEVDRIIGTELHPLSGPEPRL
jgi:hypothetical protein